MHLLYVPNMVIWLFYDIDNLLVGKLEERERERKETKTQNMKYLDIFLLRIIMQVHEWDQVLGLAYHVSANRAQADKVVQVCEHCSWQEFRGACWL